MLIDLTNTYVSIEDSNTKATIKYITIAEQTLYNGVSLRPSSDEWCMVHETVKEGALCIIYETNEPDNTDLIFTSVETFLDRYELLK